MKAILQKKYGGPEVLRVVEIAKPEVAEEEVLVRVAAAGVDPGVWHLMTGLPYLIRIMGYGLRAPKNRIPGTDFAGWVEAVGGGVDQFQPGDEVYGFGQGCWAEYVCARADRLAAKPSSLGFVQAAVVPTSAITALQGLRDKGRIEAGQQVLIIGASGGVGSFAVQLAKVFGAKVTGVCSTTKMDLVRSLGADACIDYTREDFADGRRRWDLILDTAGNRSLTHLCRALAPQGTLVIVGGEDGGRWLGGTDRLLRALLLSPFIGPSLRPFIAAARREDLVWLAECLEAGEISPVVDRNFPLAGAAEAVRQQIEGHPRGKLALTVTRDP